MTRPAPAPRMPRVVFFTEFDRAQWINVTALGPVDDEMLRAIEEWVGRRRACLTVAPAADTARNGEAE